MTRKEAEHLIPVLQEWIKGKPIQKAIINTYGNIIGWETIDNVSHINIANPNNLRVKPKSKYRPFKDASEFLNESQKHNPIGWIKHKTGEYCQQIICIVNSGNIYVGGTDIPIDNDTLLEYYTFIDGKPCGIKEE